MLGSMIVDWSHTFDHLFRLLRIPWGWETRRRGSLLGGLV